MDKRLDINNKKAALFDMDGTIVNSLHLWEDIDREFFALHNLEFDENYCNVINTMSLYECAVYTKNTYKIPWSPEEIVAKWLSMAEDHYANRLYVYDHAKEYINELKYSGIKLALVTASSEKLYRSFLVNNKLADAFDATVSVDEVKKSKSHPDAYLLAASKLGIAPCHCVVFDDDLNALKAAFEAGFTTIAVNERKSVGSLPEKRKYSLAVIDDFSCPPRIICD
ncbi:MAG: HAD family phosphatase [Clostridia bacterium]|nr:HAD family phosphatase [Clostridia bacterium]